VGAAFLNIQFKVANLNLDQTGERTSIFHSNFTPSNGGENGAMSLKMQRQPFTLIETIMEHFRWGGYFSDFIIFSITTKNSISRLRIFLYLR